MPVYHCNGCPLEVANDPSQSCVTRQTSHVGMVLDGDEYNGAHDSDFYALVWNPDRGLVQRVWYRSTAHWTDHNGMIVDATAEVIAAAEQWHRDARLAKAIADAEAAARRPDIGRRVKSLTTKGAGKGVEGVVEWTGPNRYRSGGTRVGIHVAGEPKRRYLPADRVLVLDPEPVDHDALRRWAANLTVRSWASAYRTIHPDT